MLYQSIQFLLCLTCHISTPQKALKVFAAVDLHFTFQRHLSVRSLIAVRMHCFPAWHLHGSSIKYCHPQQSTCPDKWKSPFLSSFPVNITLPSFCIPPTFISFDLELHTHRLYKDAIGTTEEIEVSLKTIIQSWTGNVMSDLSLLLYASLVTTAGDVPLQEEGNAKFFECRIVPEMPSHMFHK